MSVAVRSKAGLEGVKDTVSLQMVYKPLISFSRSLERQSIDWLITVQVSIIICIPPNTLLGLGELGLLGPMSGWLGPGGVVGLLPQVPGGPLLMGASSAVFWVDAWLSLRWAFRVLCSVGGDDGLGLVALSSCF